MCSGSIFGCFIIAGFIAILLSLGEEGTYEPGKDPYQFFGQCGVVSGDKRKSSFHGSPSFP